jgi:hypothetical protein
MDDPLGRYKVDSELAPMPNPVLVGYPCARALADYGALALPEVATAYLKEDRVAREAAFAWVLLNGNTKSTRVYLQGLLMENPDYRSKMTLLDLLPKLQDKNKNKD